MSSARVDDNIQIIKEGSNGGSQQHIESEIIINPGGCGSGSGPSRVTTSTLASRRTAQGPKVDSIIHQNRINLALPTVEMPGRCMATAVSRATSLKTWGLGPATARYRQGCLPAEEPETTVPELQAPQTDVQKSEKGRSWLLWD